jgi:hypothetical protein
MKYKYQEDKVLQWLTEYVESTYSKHYKGDIQPTEMIFSANHGEGFCIGNIIKYASRWGKKNGKNIDDLYKVIHYAIILIGMTEAEREKTLGQKNQSWKDRKLDGGEYSEGDKSTASEFLGN